MRTASLYSLTAEITDRVLADPRPADALIARFFRERTYLGSHDRRFIADTMYALVRHKRRLEELAAAANGAAGTSLTGAIALLGALTATAHTPAPTDYVQALAEAAKIDMLQTPAFIESCRTTAAVLPDTLSVEQIARTESFPDWLVARLAADHGVERAAQLCAALNTQAPITLRVNTLVTTVEACVKALADESLPTDRGTIVPTALRLHRRVNIFQSAVFKRGWFEVQDEGSQAISVFADPHPHWKVLDACAGAGGKTLHLAALMKNTGEIFAVVQNKYQDAELRRRLRRAGVQNVRVINGTVPGAMDAFAGSMHVVLVDAPCSGTGTIRRNPTAKWRLSEEKVHDYAAAQLGILEQYKTCVGPKGKLLYATCSLLNEENQNVAAAFLANGPNFAPDTRGAHALPLTERGTLELFPDRHNTDGFFAAAFTRSA